MGFLEDSRKSRIELLQKIGLKAGDYVSLYGYFGDCWFQIETVCNNYISGKYNKRNLLESTSNIVKYHRQNDPWDYKEIRCVTTVDGSCYRDYKVPDNLKYKGAFNIVPWLWCYKNRNCDPKKPIDLNAFSNKKLVNVSSFEVEDLVNTIQKTVINGWRPIVEIIPTQKFNFSCKVCKNECNDKPMS